MKYITTVPRAKLFLCPDCVVLPLSNEVNRAKMIIVEIRLFTCWRCVDDDTKEHTRQYWGHSRSCRGEIAK